tara:strand:+ start:1794 stop:2768 length:975 start_codon:yes stop_codon:yes gene_type:complete
MNNIKKIGLSALAGSLAMVSAQAGDFTVTGGAEMTYTTTEGVGTTSNPFGMSHNIDLTGTGEVNGYGWTVFTGTTGQTMAADSSSLVFDLGTAGSIAFDQGVGDYGISDLANDTPTAYEEADHATGKSGDGLDVAGDMGVIGYENTFDGVTLSAEYNPSTGTTNKATAGGNGNADLGSNFNFATTFPMEDLTIGFGASKTWNNAVAVSDDSELTGSANYALGNVSVGAQLSEISSGTAGAASNSVLAYAVAVNINENLSVSVGRSDNTTENPGGADVDEENTGFNVAYSMGSAALRASFNSTDNVGGTRGVDDEAMELSLNLSF